MTPDMRCVRPRPPSLVHPLIAEGLAAPRPRRPHRRRTRPWPGPRDRHAERAQTAVGQLDRHARALRHLRQRVPGGRQQRPLDRHEHEPVLGDRCPQLVDRDAVGVQGVEQPHARRARRIVLQPVEQALGAPVHTPHHARRPDVRGSARAGGRAHHAGTRGRPTPRRPTPPAAARTRPATSPRSSQSRNGTDTTRAMRFDPRPARPDRPARPRHRRRRAHASQSKSEKRAIARGCSTHRRSARRSSFPRSTTRWASYQFDAKKFNVSPLTSKFATDDVAVLRRRAGHGAWRPAAAFECRSRRAAGGREGPARAVLRHALNYG